jgi:hypothetical protein
VRSSISSSDRSVWRILAVAAAIVGIYQLVAPRFFPGGGSGHDQWQQNLIKAQRLVYADTTPAVIVVGSSKLARVEFAQDASIENLALNGGGSLTGLDVILRAGVRPRMVLIEIGDAILREPDEKFLDSVFGVVNRQARRLIPVLRDAYQPGVLINGAAQAWASNRTGPQDDAVRPDLLRQLLDIQRTSHARLPDSLTMARVVGELGTQVMRLHAAGVAVTFVEPPEHVELWNSPMSVSIRRSLHAAFGDAVAWFPDQDPVAYRTTDSVHLDRASADRYGAALVTWLASH